MTPLLPTPRDTDCWNTIGIRGDRSCPELTKVIHCHDCPVFAAAGRRFLDAPSPDGYLAEWTARLAEPVEEVTSDQESVLVFDLEDERLALSVHAIVEVTTPRPVHRIPFRAGILSGLVNIRGELYLCIQLTKLLGMNRTSESRSTNRLLVVAHGTAKWVFPVDAADQVIRIPRCDVTESPATVARAATHLSRGVFSWEGRPVGLLDHARLFETLQARIR